MPESAEANSGIYENASSWFSFAVEKRLVEYMLLQGDANS